MAEPKDTTSFFRKVVKFVANPGTEWTDLDAPSDETRESDYAKGELKAMIERKRRNDFVRKREFDMLRKVRREGLTGEQLAALGGSSRIDDSVPRSTDTPARQDAGVKAKIDEIEQQMVGDGYSNTQRRAPEFYNAPTQPATARRESRLDRWFRRRTAARSRTSSPARHLRRSRAACAPLRRHRHRCRAPRRSRRSTSTWRRRKTSARPSASPTPKSPMIRTSTRP